jgi:hypothetical protein
MIIAMLNLAAFIIEIIIINFIVLSIIVIEFLNVFNINQAIIAIRIFSFHFPYPFIIHHLIISFINHLKNHHQ